MTRKTPRINSAANRAGPAKPEKIHDSQSPGDADLQLSGSRSDETD
jgi:hypothetical protein